MAPFDDRASRSLTRNGPDRPRLRIAVVGTGISGLSAAWLLSLGHDVTVYEKNARIGGHSNTVVADLPEGPVPVDTGFIVYNERNYPNLTAMFNVLDVKTSASNMSFAASLETAGGRRFEYSGSGLNGIFADRRNIASPRMWRMIGDILKLYRSAPGLALQAGLDEKPLGEFLREQGYSASLRDDHLLPMCAAIWSLPIERVEQFPALAFLRFFDNHGLMGLSGRPAWRTVTGGSREYVSKLAMPFGARIRTGCGVTSISRDASGVTVSDTKGGVARYDHVVIAAHSDEALSLLADADRRERALLGAMPYQRNVAWLHSDPAYMPLNKRVWSSWNYMGGGAGSPVCVSYWMNRLQPLPTERPLFVTLNPSHDPAPGSVHARIDYDHPVFDTGAFAAQRQLWDIQGVRRTWFCGAYFGSGFHEDGLQAGLAVAEQLGGVQRPWTVANPSSRISLAPPPMALAVTT
ncbi:MAG: FAD-dependent oxidoreductase [Parvibaculum sp.]|uniref:NAD(P)/FAD-dependent oxidoreductase n=1 Tax=Parvibaculum sp. TaxID=2024848 RepID=UPI0027181F4E|nr:FAD-dependent oxidoreductase [Parvibaculum sp.]MDO8837318.1 FAD-dependent oxidoreductase [Parvibaculum sp.]